MSLSMNMHRMGMRSSMRIKGMKSLGADTIDVREAAPDGSGEHTIVYLVAHG